MPNDPFVLQADSATAPSRAPFAVAASDTDPLPVVPKGLYVGTAGDIVLRGAGASADVLFRNVAAGQILDVRASHVRATGTTASISSRSPDAARLCAPQRGAATARRPRGTPAAAGARFFHRPGRRARRAAERGFLT